MAFEVASTQGPRKDVNVTPLIDVVLVLLIIFMVLTPSMLKHLTPTVAKDAPGPTTPALPVAVELASDGTLSVNGATTAWERLQDTVRTRLAQSGQRAVFFTIADEVDYGRAIRLMDLCKGAGAEVLGLPRAL